MPTTAKGGCRQAGHTFFWSETSAGFQETRGSGLRQGAEIALVVPRAVLLGQDARQSFAIEIDPLVGAAIESYWQVFQRVRIDIANLRADFGLGVLKLHWWQRFFPV